MKTIKRELAHVGMFGSDGTKITKQDLADCAETFDGKCPVSLGHKLADYLPKFGNVSKVALTSDGESLSGDVELHDLLADAVDEKFYEDVSVGINTRKVDGKRYLHHLAYLGAVPPKIRDLKVFADLGAFYCGDDEGVVEFSEAPLAPVLPPQPSSPPDTPQDVADALRRIADKGRAGWAFEDVTKALAELTSIATEMLVNGAKIPDALREPVQAFADQIAQTAGPAGEEEDVELKEENEHLKQELADSKATVLASAKEGIKTAMEGRIPKARQGLVLELADRLGDSECIELADDADPTKKTKVSSLEVLRRVVESIPKPVAEGRVDLGDPGESPEGKPLDLSKIAGKF
jgi:hypothetical protein